MSHWVMEEPICNGCSEGYHNEHKKEMWWVDEDGDSEIRTCRCKECHNAV